ncbi:unnamed protein product [Lota lota]
MSNTRVLVNTPSPDAHPPLPLATHESAGGGTRLHHEVFLPLISMTFDPPASSQGPSTSTTKRSASLMTRRNVDGNRRSFPEMGKPSGVGTWLPGSAGELE